MAAITALLFVNSHGASATRPPARLVRQLWPPRLCRRAGSQLCTVCPHVLTAVRKLRLVYAITLLSSSSTLCTSHTEQLMKIIICNQPRP